VTWRADGPAPPDPRDVGAVDASEVLVDGPWRHRFVAANGARFHVAEGGDPDGPLVLFLHGFFDQQPTKVDPMRALRCD